MGGRPGARSDGIRAGGGAYVRDEVRTSGVSGRIFENLGFGVFVAFV